MAISNSTPLSGHVQGMVVYNKNTAGDVTPDFYYNSELNENIQSRKSDTPTKPELKLFAIDQIDTNGKKNDSIIMTKPELMPYTVTKKKKIIK